MVINNTYKDRNVLVTGHTGFKGSWLSIWLNELGANVIGYSLEPYTNNDNYVVTKLDKKITSVIGDIRDYNKLLETFKKYKPEIVFHLAAQSLVLESYKDPRGTFEVNTGGTVNILEASRRTDSVKTILNITSDKCYDNKEWVWGYRESDPVGGIDPYSCSKGCSELITNSYRKSLLKDKTISTARAGNVIGGGDWNKHRLIPDCIRALKNNNIIEVRNPNAKRPWQFVLEPLYGYLVLASKMIEDKDRYSGSWNFGPNPYYSLSVKDLVMKIIENWGDGSWIDISKEESPYETTTLNLDISKAINYLNWKPIYNIGDAIIETIDWYKSPNVDYQFDVEQIKKYDRLIR